MNYVRQRVANPDFEIVNPGVESCKSIFFGVDLVGGVYPVRKRGEQAEGHIIADIGSSPTSQVIGKMGNRGYGNRT